MRLSLRLKIPKKPTPAFSPAGEAATCGATRRRGQRLDDTVSVQPTEPKARITSCFYHDLGKTSYAGIFCNAEGKRCAGEIVSMASTPTCLSRERSECYITSRRITSGHLGSVIQKQFVTSALRLHPENGKCRSTGHHGDSDAIRRGFRAMRVYILCSQGNRINPLVAKALFREWLTCTRPSDSRGGFRLTRRD
jgi:hypothetical protein